ncbi:MAG: activase, partial [Aquificaceae bacterium]
MWEAPTCKYANNKEGNILHKAYERHNTRQAEKVLEFLLRLEENFGLTAGRDRVYMTGSGGGSIAGFIGARFVQEVVSVATAVEKLHPDVRFVSEIG